MKKTLLNLSLLPFLSIWSHSAIGQVIGVQNVNFQNTGYTVEADGNVTLIKMDNIDFIYKQAIWVTGKSFGQDTINHLSAQQYRQSRVDFYPGPISSDSASYDHWNRTWTVTAAQVDSVKQGLYTIIPEAIKSWPVSGRAQYGESADLAPYQDVDDNGSYEPENGDYPLIKGDICSIAIFNDYNQRGFYRYWSFQMEGIAWHYMLEGNGIEQRAFFTEFELLNKSNTTYHEAWISMFADIDVGAAAANLNGTDIARHSVYAYPYASYAGRQYYHDKTPYAAVSILEGPAADAFDGRDNNWDGCVDGVSDGLGNCISEDPSNGIVEPTTMMSSMGYQNESFGHNRTPLIDAHYINYMHGLWSDGSNIMIETPSGFHSTSNGDGHNPGVAMGISHYVFPGNSFVPDPLFASLPIHDVNFFEAPTDTHDKRQLASAGKFTWEPNEKITFRFATLMGTVDTADYANIIDSIGSDIDKLLAVSRTLSQSEPVVEESNFILGQDKSHLYLTNPYSEDFSVELRDLSGRLVATDLANANSQMVIPIEGLPAGVYLLQIPDRSFVIKWVKP